MQSHAASRPATTILNNAQAKGRQLSLAYAGAVTPREAFELTESGNAKVVDVRSRFEHEFVGRIPGAKLVEWRIYDADGEGGIGSRLNPRFVDQLKALHQPEETLLFLCRSAVRSHQAAEAAAAAGFTCAYNILEGFEGDKDAGDQRGHTGGWRQAGLPWTQG
jgi:rhodanese-related sulfurtransferase